MNAEVARAASLSAGADPWAEVAASDAFSDVTSRVGKVNREAYRAFGRFPVVDQGQVMIAGYCDEEKLAYKGPLPVVVFGDHTRVLKFVDFEFIAGADGTKTLLPNTELVYPLFLYFALRKLDLRSRGYNRHFRLLKEASLPLPPLEEQQAIAGVLRTVQRAIEATDGVIAATRALKASMMRHLFTYGPVPVADAPSVALRDTEVGPVPEAWEVVRLGALSEVKGGKRLPKGHAFASSPTPFPYVRVVDFDHETVDPKELKFLTDADASTLRRYVITSDDVYISIAGTVGLVGTVPDQLSGAYLTENAARIVTTSRRVHRRFLVGFLASAGGQVAIRSRTAKTSQPKLALARIRDIPVPLPPADDQTQIAFDLDAIGFTTKQQEGRRQALETLFQSLLQNLMTGRIRVQDRAPVQAMV